jgi:hypothetical protein
MLISLIVTNTDKGASDVSPRHIFLFQSITEIYQNENQKTCVIWFLPPEHSYDSGQQQVEHRS